MMKHVLMVDENGIVVDGDEVLCIIAKLYKKLGLPIGGVVGTLMSNFGVEKALAALDISFARADVGDRFVMESLKEKGWLVGGEPSGHIICLDKHTTGDGIIAALQVLAAMQVFEQSLASLKQVVKKIPQVLVNVPVQDKSSVESKDVLEAVASVEADLKERGRVLLRPSGTEQLIRVMVEGEDLSKIKSLAENLREVVMEQ